MKTRNIFASAYNQSPSGQLTQGNQNEIINSTYE